MPHILLIDDDEKLAALLRQFFDRHELALDSATTPSQGMAMLAAQPFDLVILDIMLPEMDGFEVCRSIRKNSDIPIIMLTARGEVMDRVVGLEMGADDYLPKPFEPRELVARIQSILKRSTRQSSSGALLQYAGLRIDTLAQAVTISGEEVELSSMEYRLLELLAFHPGEILSRDVILNALKGVDAEIYTRSVDILVSRLRHKLKPLDYIKTVRGSGYRFTGRAYD